MKNISDKLSEQLTGAICNNFRFVEGGTLILYFRDSEFRIWIDCAWRLRNKQQILVGSIDNADLVLAEIQKIQKLSIESTQVNDVTKDLQLLFSNEAVIECFCYSIEDEMWEFRRSDGYRLGIGATLQAFEKYEAPDD